MLTFRQLMLLTPPEIRKRSASCKRSQLTFSARSRNRQGVFNDVRLRVQCGEKPHKVAFRVYDTDKLPAVNRRVWVHCDCGYFTFNLETSLTARGSSMVLDSTGTFPRQRNKKFTPHMCKHIYKAAERALKVTPDKVVTFDKLPKMRKTVRLKTPAKPKKV